MKEFTIVRGLFDTRKRALIIDEERIRFENKDLKNDLFTVIDKKDITGIRYGIHFINGYHFTIGREYLIFIRLSSGNELRISFKLFYGRKLKEKHQLYVEIVDALWDCFFNDILDQYDRKLENSEVLTIAGIEIAGDRIKFNGSEILFKELELKRYYHCFMVFSKKNPHLNKMLYYLKDQDAVILLNILNNIIKNERLRAKEISDRTV
ncbi:hypothetical protein [uncultured Chryseobacterium sp.]|uniref:hypothetical protein n=1 Tax=uncultured Chryseobacterium sp. TaxID=259322 RepID=UPI0025FC0596|nr:hypothetical protein [uncultured Chryseobacterium sp.]